MKNLFNPESPVMQMLSRAADLMLLNLLWMICCVPIITIGASTAALYSVTLKMASGEEGGIARDFFQGFRNNFKQGTLTFLILLLPWVLLAVNVVLIFSGALGQNYLMALLVLPGCVLLILVNTYVYPLMARFSNGVWQTLKNAVLLSVGNLPVSLLMSVLNLAPVIWLFMSPESFMKGSIWILLIGFSGIAWVNGKFLTRIFQKLIPQSPEEVQA